MARRRQRAGRAQQVILSIVEARLVEADGDLDAIEPLLDRAQEGILETAWFVHQPTLHEARARLARLRGDTETGDRELAEAERLYIEMGATGHAERVAQELSS